MNGDLVSYGRLVKYFEVLVERFPESITHHNLAEGASVTRSAVSRVKNRIYDFCRVRDLIYRRKMILRTDPDIFWKLVGIFWFEGKLKMILLSRYGKYMIGNMIDRIHSELSTQIEGYSKFFNKNDTEWIVNKIVLHNLVFLDFVDNIKMKVANPEVRAYVMSIRFGQALIGLIEKFEIPIENEDDLLHVLTLRDKSFFLIRDILQQMIEQMEVLRTLEEEEERTMYKKVYLNTVEFYLRKIFEELTKIVIRQRISKKELLFKEEYGKVGYFWTPKALA